MAVLYTPHFIQFLDGNGDPLSNGKLYTYSAGTTTPKATFTTATGDIENANPVILDAAGRAVLFIQGSYRFDLFTANEDLVKSTDNVTSFNTLPQAANSFFQSFSGDGTTTAFTLSENLGTDEKSLMIFIDNGLDSYVTNGDFATDTTWSKGTGWSIGSGVATASTASTALDQDSPILLNEGQSYNITYTITRSAGSVIPAIGGTDGTSRSAAGTYSETIIAGSSQKIAFTGTGFTGTLDNVSVTRVQSSGFGILNPNQYTLDGEDLSFVSAPPDGTNNIMVFAPSTLVGAASASADAAAEAEAGALAAQAQAEAAAGLLDIESTSSVLIGTGTKLFTIEADKGIAAGQFVLIDSDADGSNYMYGQITDYTLTTLTVNVLAIGGSGTFADWTITLIGIQGIQGQAGSIGDISGVALSTPTTLDTLIFTDVSDSNTTKKATTGDVVRTSGIINGATGATILGGDEILFGDISDSNNIKKTTAQDIANLAPINEQQLCKAWVNFNGTGTVAIRDSYNVSSITDNGAGDYTANFTTNLGNADYSLVGSAKLTFATGTGTRFVGQAVFTTSSARFVTESGAGSLNDVAICCVQIFGDEA